MNPKTPSTVLTAKTKPARVPKLRFPEFRAAPGWQPKRLGLALKFQAGFPFPSSGFNESGNGLRLIRNRDLRSDDIVVFYSGDFDPSFVVRNGDVLIGMDGDFTPSVWEKGEALLNQRVGRILPHGDNDHRFLLHLLTLSLKGIEQATARTTVKHLSHSAVEDKHEPLPPPAEQQKIAECLSSVDALMAAQARKVDALKTHKKGLMQQLFPTEGETQPRLRFPEFQNAGEWVDGELGPKASKVGSGITPTGGDKNYKQAGRPFVRSQNVGWGILLLDDVVYIDEETHRSFDSSEIKVRDVLLNITGASIGRSAVADERIAGGNVNQHVCIIRAKPDELNPFFLNQYLISKRGQKQIDSFQAGGNRQGLNFAQIRSFATPLPPSPAEQHRIASCLSSLDALILAETQKLDGLKTHKKGLMQQLFPTLNEPEA
jgi:type I restriction enzyme S subunit